MHQTAKNSALHPQRSHGNATTQMVVHVSHSLTTKASACQVPLSAKTQKCQTIIAVFSATNTPQNHTIASTQTPTSVIHSRIELQGDAIQALIVAPESNVMVTLSRTQR